MVRPADVQSRNAVLRVGPLFVSFALLATILLIIGLSLTSGAQSSDGGVFQTDGQLGAMRSPSQAGEIQGTKWHDLNGNGRRDVGEPGLPNWTIRLEGAGSLGETSTDQDGNYWFMDLPAGTYTVTEVLQDGWAQTWPPAGYYSLLLDPDQTIGGLDFGNLQPPVGSVHGVKWNDLNGNGSRDIGEPGLPNWTIQLEVADSLDETTTDQDGNYWFMDLPAGTYTVTEVLQDGWAQTWPPAGYYSFLLDPGLTVEGVDFGNWQPPVGSVHGAKWHDLNGNGSRDIGEPGLPNWTIQLEVADSLDETTTDQDGDYWFMDLPAGTYTVTEVLQDGWAQTWPPVGYYSFLLDPGLTVEGVDFGNLQPPVGSVHGVKWNDLNGNGSRDIGEPGLPNWTIRLEGAGNLDETTTDGDGNYWFMDLPAGTYTATEVLQDGWAQTWPPAGYYSFLLDPGLTVEGVDLGNWLPPVGNVHGAKWHDLNGNGSRDGGEPGLPSWTIQLEGASSLDETSTDQDGNYWFMDLPAGTYTVTEVLQDGWAQTWPPAGYYSFLLDPGLTIQGLNFGNRYLLPHTIFLPAILKKESD